MNQNLFCFKNGIVIHNKGLYRINDVYSKRLKYIDYVELSKFGSHQAFLLRSFLDYKIIFKVRIQVSAQDDSALIIRILKKFSKFLTKVKVLQNPSITIKATFLSRVNYFFSNQSMSINNVKAYRKLSELLDSTCDSNFRIVDLKTLFNNTIKFPFNSVSLNLTAINTEKLLSLLSVGQKHINSIRYFSLHIRNKSCIEFDDLFKTEWSQKVIILTIETKFYSLFKNVLPNIANLTELRVLNLLVDQEFEVIDVEKRLLKFESLSRLSKLQTFKFKTCMQNCYNHLLWTVFEFLFENTNATSLVFNLTSTDDIENNPQQPNIQLPKTSCRKVSVKDLELNLTSVAYENLNRWTERLKEKLNKLILESLQLRISTKQYSQQPLNITKSDLSLFDVCLTKKLKLNILKMENISYNAHKNISLNDGLEELYIDTTVMINVGFLLNVLPWKSLKMLFLKIKMPVILEDAFSVLDNLKYAKNTEHVTIDLNPMGFIDALHLLKFIDFILAIKFCCRELVVILRQDKPLVQGNQILDKLHDLRNHFSAQKALWRLDIRLGDIFLHKYSPNGPVKLIMDEL